ncbi:hypothetical protein, partial [Chromohalobacter sp. 296-RDG]|uniref:hypothetical protein n=2 Tax=unclassified Chromohalobacter TaxID=2628571 RepID=UPI002468497D
DMAPPCMRCHSQHLINLETARKLGIAAGALAGSLKSVYGSLYAVRVPTVPSPHLPLSRVASAVIAGASGGIAGAAAGNQMVRHLLPPGEGSPWLCLGCGHTFRVLD